MTKKFQEFTPREYLKIDIANNYGLDKLSWNERIKWFDDNENQLDQLVSSAEEPALFYAGILAWQDVQEGNPTGYLISLDATASGMQLLAALTGDRKAAELCNVIPTGSREDAYTNIYNIMLNKIQDISKISRDDTKVAIMTSLYGSTALPKEIFGEGELLRVFYDTMKEQAPAAWELNEAFLAMWDADALIYQWILPDNFHVNIKVMGQVNETVHMFNEPFTVTRYENMPIPEGRSLSANCVHSLDGMIVRELVRRCSYDPGMVTKLKMLLSFYDLNKVNPPAKLTDHDKMVLILWDHYTTTGYLSARIMEHLNEDNLHYVDIPTIWELVNSLPVKPFTVVTIHDAFRCLPTYGNDLRKQYNIQLQAIAKSNLLGDLISQIIGKTVHIGKLDPNLHIEIIDSNYALS